MKSNCSHRTRIAGVLIGSICLLAGAGCKPRDSGAQVQPHALPSEGELAALPLGDIAGAASLRAGNEVANPLRGDPGAIEEGHRLFIVMNCAGCHGYDAKGNMGPNLTDAYWRYGGTPSSIYNSIYEGRPQGMPAWGRALPERDIWKLVAYLQSLGGAVAWDQYHAGLQGDHDVTTAALEAEGPPGASANPGGTGAPAEQALPSSSSTPAGSSMPAAPAP